ncbi:MULTISPECIES: tRNA cyclic N6-threonylcarbamoyladenosine(37) synthase TcdA [unclassified Neptuniibacter]|uniref:tRNA cyclic N6-threonylcarbamoyladenosine(37) synthase TcdA n=1 Tax=unclassified Neptuniibacter TaxID=2630693 RepID=UPI000C3E6150|nr:MULTISPECIES: tRNA cyclic N6-threonylcarbamoyladenosine(37) synthase TcdA [unclassified Neptuniibacter]MAY43331.1 tRNA cyclic N6-threonylcarbamoyladenosine(37) synthase TcdA [Oceanospirillaceae bacterium]
MSDNFENRFGGTRRLYGNDVVDMFNQSHICVIGIGGVGSWVAEALARTAIGTITLIDLDDICITNTNRQIHAVSGNIGRSKTEAMAERIRLINPDCVVNEIDDFITIENIPELITSDFDYVIDAIDSVKEKAALISHCNYRKIPIITVGGAGGQTDPTKIDICDLAKTSHDPLAAKVRSFLRRHYQFSKSGRRFSVDCVYSTEQLVYPQPDGSVCANKSQMDGGTRLDCASGFGASTCVTATFGFAAVARVLEKMKLRWERQLNADRKASDPLN